MSPHAIALTPRDFNALTDFQFYYYNPSLAAAITFIVLFSLTTTAHFYRMIRTKTWFMIPFCIGGVFESVGYIGRVLSARQAPAFTVGPYVLQATLLLVAPALFAASVYMQLARIVQLVDGERVLFIKRQWLTRLFVSGDVCSFLLQATGGGLMADWTSGMIHLGRTLVLLGLFLQIVYFALFVVASAVFHHRLRQSPTAKCRRHPWRRHMTALYLVSGLIFARSVVRTVEYVQGFTGYIVTHELFLYLFDALLMFLVMMVMICVHPSEVQAGIRAQMRDREHLAFLQEAAKTQTST